MSNGQNAGNGFIALAELDSNSDGCVDANDPGWSSLLVWRDLNGNGRTDEGELHSLESIGILALNTSYAESYQSDSYQNEYRQIGSYIAQDGSARAAVDVWFKINRMYRIAENAVAVPTDIGMLPNLLGYGELPDLRQAMATDSTGTLKSLLASFAAETNLYIRSQLTEKILFEWSGVTDVPIYSRWDSGAEGIAPGSWCFSKTSSAMSTWDGISTAIRCRTRTVLLRDLCIKPIKACLKCITRT